MYSNPHTPAPDRDLGNTIMNSSHLNFSYSMETGEKFQPSAIEFENDKAQQPENEGIKLNLTMEGV